MNLRPLGYEPGATLVLVQPICKDPAAVALGRRGGLKTRENHTPEQRSEMARKAVLARWARRGVIDLDEDSDNADWTKRTWDLPIHDVENLKGWIRSWGMTVEQFKKSPVYRWNVDKLPWLQKL